MARLRGNWLIQQIETAEQDENGNPVSMVILFEEGTEREIGRFDPADADAAARFQKVIYDSSLPDETKAFAHFWCGYFYANARRA